MLGSTKLTQAQLKFPASCQGPAGHWARGAVPDALAALAEAPCPGLLQGLWPGLLPGFHLRSQSDGAGQAGERGTGSVSPQAGPQHGLTVKHHPES